MVVQKSALRLTEWPESFSIIAVVYIFLPSSAAAASVEEEISTTSTYSVHAVSSGILSSISSIGQGTLELLSASREF